MFHNSRMNLVSIGLTLAVLVVVPSVYGAEIDPRHVAQYNERFCTDFTGVTEMVPLKQLMGDWYVQYYAFATSMTFESQTCVKLTFSGLDKQETQATFKKSYIPNGTNQVQAEEFGVQQVTPDALLFQIPDYFTYATLLKGTNDETFVHGTCQKYMGVIGKSNRITIATRERQVSRADVLKTFAALNTNEFVNRLEVSQNNCIN